jgi:hypothetical protein
MALAHHRPARVGIVIEIKKAAEIRSNSIIDVFQTATPLFYHFRLKGLQRESETEFFSYSIAILPLQKL